MFSLRCLILMYGIPSVFFLAVIYYGVFYTPYTQKTVHPLAYRQEIEGGNSQNKYSIFIYGPRIVDIPFNKTITDTYSYLIPRAAFFDKRARGKYKNATVILTHITKSHLKVNACIVDDHYVSEFEVNSLSLNTWIHRHHPDCTHDDVVIFCFNTPGRNNSKVSVVYENPKNALEHFVTESEHPLFIPKSRKNAKTFSSSIMVCTTVYGSPPYFGAWLHYQKTLGVDLVYINAMQSFQSSKFFNDSFFQESVRNGFVQLKVWKEYLKPRATFYHSQALNYQNCLYRFQDVYNYAIFADVDDFLIPSGGEIKQTLPNIFNPRSKLSSAHLEWIRYFEPNDGFNFTTDSLIADGNLTRSVNVSLGIVFENNCKSVYKLSATSEVGVHQSKNLTKGYKRRGIHRNKMYMAHVKRHIIVH